MKNHWNATARFWDIKDFSLSSVKNIGGEQCIKQKSF